MSKNFIAVLPTSTLSYAIALMQNNQQNCVLVVDKENLLEGILTLGDIRRRGFGVHGEMPSTPKEDSAIKDVCFFMNASAYRFTLDEIVSSVFI